MTSSCRISGSPTCAFNHCTYSWCLCVASSGVRWMRTRVSGCRSMYRATCRESTAPSAPSALPEKVSTVPSSTRRLAHADDPNATDVAAARSMQRVFNGLIESGKPARKCARRSSPTQFDRARILQPIGIQASVARVREMHEGEGAREVIDGGALPRGSAAPSMRVVHRIRRDSFQRQAVTMRRDEARALRGGGRRDVTRTLALIVGAVALLTPLGESTAQGPGVFEVYGARSASSRDPVFGGLALSGYSGPFGIRFGGALNLTRYDSTV